jgi:hypothetical protein
MTIYLPDDLATEVKAELGDSNISSICQEALRQQLGRTRVRAFLMEKGFERVEAWDAESEVAFQGHRVAGDEVCDVYLTPRGKIAVVHTDTLPLSVYDDFGHFEADYQGANALLANVASALGEKYVRELDI